MITWNVDPEIFRLGSIAVRWYGLMFVIGFLIGERYASKVLREDKGKTQYDASRLVNYMLLGTFLGARLGHCLFYDPLYYLSNPLEILMVWKGGLASHGGYAGIILGAYFYSRKYKDLPFLWLMDMIAGPALLTGGLIRLGNLMNSEIIGKPSDLPWSFIFKRVDDVARHPTQIYESIGYFTISAILFYLFKKYNKTWLRGRILGVAMVISFSFRFFIEFFKENQVAFEQGMSFNMGQWLSIPFVIIGLLLFFEVHKPLLKPFDFSVEKNPSGKKQKKKSKR